MGSLFSSRLDARTSVASTAARRWSRFQRIHCPAASAHVSRGGPRSANQARCRAALRHGLTAPPELGTVLVSKTVPLDGLTRWPTPSDLGERLRRTRLAGR